MGTTEEEIKKEAKMDKKKKVTDDVVVFIRKRSGLDTPRLIARLKSYINFQQKRRRANAVRRRPKDAQYNQSRKKAVTELKQKPSEICEHHGKEDEKMSGRSCCDKIAHRSGWWSGHNSGELIDCGCRGRRRMQSRRRRSCRRRRSRRRRRRSCRRRRRSRYRRRRRRSCRRRRRRRRRCR